MAAFSSLEHQHPFLHQLTDSSPPSIFLPNSTIHTISLLDYEPNNALLSSPLDHHHHHHQIINLDHHPTTNTEISGNNNGGGSSNNNNEASAVTDYYYHNKCHDHSSSKLTPNPIPMIKKRKSSKQSSSPNSAQSKDMREGKEVKKQKKMKDCEEKKNSKEEEEEKKDYIHVRARRGQATDSHSLAERVRREKISERMKLLQALVPGCDKVRGKALMLDEIINYVQSLQNQVEFLSMKLASVNPMFYDFGMDLESTIMAGHDQNLSSLASHSPLPSVQECILDNSANSFLLQQSHVNPNGVSQGHRQVLWEEEDQRKRIINQTEESFNSLFSLH